MSDQEFKVEIEPTVVPRGSGFDLTIWKNHSGFGNTDLTLNELIQIRDKLILFVDEQPKFFVILARGMSNDPEIHKEGCADIKRGIRSGKYNDVQRLEVSVLEDAARWFWEDFLPGGCAYEENGPGSGMTDAEAQGYTHYLPCTKGL